MAVSNRSGTIPRYNAEPDFPSRPGYFAPGSSGPSPLPPASVGPQKGLMRVETVPGDPSFPHDIVQRQMHPKSRPVASHPATPSRRLRGQHAPTSGQVILDQGAAAAAGLESVE
jgi:hypothetical protein